jgi:hypothetical protein
VVAAWRGVVCDGVEAGDAWRGVAASTSPHLISSHLITSSHHLIGRFISSQPADATAVPTQKCSVVCTRC